MLALALCGSAFVACFIAARRSLVQGLAALLAVGYAYGIVRANVPSPASHFLFDAGVAGSILLSGCGRPGLSTVTGPGA